MKNFKNKMGKFTITLLLVLSCIGLPVVAFAEEENPTPSPSVSPTPTPTASPTPTPSESPTPTPTPSPTPTATPTEKPVEKKIKLDKTSIEAVPGAAINIKATVTGVEDAKIKWTSSNTAVATVSNGVVKALKSGNVTITAALENDSSVTAQCIITITTKANETPTPTTEEKDKNKEKESLNLKSLKVKGYTLNEPFSSSRTGYTVDIPYEAEDVTIEVEKQSNNVKTEIKGATNLKVGRNQVTVTVKDNSGNSKVYTITVIRATKEEKETKKKPTSHVVSKASSSLKPSSTRKNHTLEYAFVTIGCLTLFSIGGLGIYFYIITSGKDKNKKKEKKEKKKSATKKIAKEKETKNEKIEEEKVETPIIEVPSDDDDELGKTIEFTERPTKLEEKKEIPKIQEVKKETPTNLKKESAILKEVEDLFDDE